MARQMARSFRSLSCRVPCQPSSLLQTFHRAKGVERKTPIVQVHMFKKRRKTFCCRTNNRSSFDCVWYNVLEIRESVLSAL